MQRITGTDEVSVYMCLRCGTNKIEDSSLSAPRVYVPKLVPRITEFASKLTDDHQDLIDVFERLGIRESIMVDSGMV